MSVKWFCRLQVLVTKSEQKKNKPRPQTRKTNFCVYTVMKWNLTGRGGGACPLHTKKDLLPFFILPFCFFKSKQTQNSRTQRFQWQHHLHHVPSVWSVSVSSLVLFKKVNPVHLNKTWEAQPTQVTCWPDWIQETDLLTLTLENCPAPQVVLTALLASNVDHQN